MPTSSALPGPRGLTDIGQVVLSGALGLMFAPISWVLVREGGLGSGWTAVLLMTLALLHLTVLAAGWRPLGALVVGSLCMAVLLVSPDLGGPTAEAAGSDYSPLLLPSSLCFLTLLYAVSARTRRPWPNVALALGLVGAALITVRLWGFTVTGLASWAWQLMQVTVVLTGVVAAWALGRFVAVRTAWASELAARGAADERRRIAREMHDVVAHSLAVVVSHAEAGRLVVAREPDRAAAILDTIAGTGREALTEMRGLLGVLRSSSEDAAPTPSGPQPGLDDLPALLERIRATGQRVDLSPAELPRGGSPAVGLTAYRVVQEALTNVIRHAGPGTSARVVVTVADDLVIEVSDDGATASAAPPGRGITGMRERVEAVGGELHAGPAEQGWRVRARLPWEGAAHGRR